MLKIAVISIFPAMFDAILNDGVISRAFKKKICQLRLYNPRDYSKNKYRKVDDRPYGGGGGMLMMVEPLSLATEDAKKWTGSKTQVCCMDATGTLFNQKIANNFATKDNIIFVCGRYKGIDQRYIDEFVDIKLSAGRFVVSGGELPVMLVIDAVLRQVPGVLGNEESKKNDSFYAGENKDCPHWTRPATYKGRHVPEILISGNHANIKKWQDAQKK
jgi:tRNA (guanine37-N1)-methyltransferase